MKANTGRDNILNIMSAVENGDNYEEDIIARAGVPMDGSE